ncbi:MAG: hypothetical protein M1821_008150 [Bathelium mastoideum]|nr:MAG: hypothetical protein M1821_008150 [Bathelium mastoideum]KAI9693193.1 MAG: hypothetical protein M1822_005189 [Bathelium mastoideum]
MVNEGIQLIELLTNVIKYVEKNEPGTLQYSLTREVDKENPDIVMIETYKDLAAYEAHQTSQPFQDLFKAAQAEELLAGTPQVIQTRRTGGFASRDN